MDLRQLRYFVAIVEAGSISRAAERVHVAQSALSLHLRRLEDSLGTQLLVREPRGIRPTEAGEILLARARQILGLLEDTERDLRSTRAEPAGAVAIGIPAGVGRLLNAPLLDACARKLPRVSLRIVEVLPTDVADWLDAGRIQLGICYDIGAEARTPALAEEECHLVSASPVPGLGDSVTLDELARIPLVLPVCTYNPEQCVAERAKALGTKLMIETRVDSLATIMELVLHRSRRTILTPGAVLPEWREGKLVAYPIVPPLKRSVLIDAAPASAGEPAPRAVEALVRETAAELVSEGAWPARFPSRYPQAA